MDALSSSGLRRVTKNSAQLERSYNGLCTFTVGSAGDHGSNHRMHWLTLIKTSEKAVDVWVFGSVVQGSLVRAPKLLVRVSRVESWLHTQFQPPANVCSERQQVTVMLPHAYFPVTHVKNPVWSFWLLILALPSFSCCTPLGSYLTHGRTLLSLSLP